MGRKSKLPEEKSSLIGEFKPRTDKQAELSSLIHEKEVTIAVGPPGTGKSYVALATALNLLNKGYNSLILVKSVTTLPGEEIGFIKGGIDEKMEPFMVSFTWNIDKIAGKNASKNLMDKGLIQVLPLAYVRGISIDNSIVLLDECVAGESLIYIKSEENKKLFRNSKESIKQIVKNFLQGEKIEVLSHNDITGELEYKEVINAKNTGTKDVLGITVQQSSVPIKCSFEHPFAIYKDGTISYIPAKELQVGDRLLLAKDGKNNHTVYNDNNHKNLSNVTITSIDYLGKEEVYNLEVKDNNNYFVNGILTHNCQNFSAHTFKTIMTRIGENSKYILLGDIEQIDMKRKEESCLKNVLEAFEDCDFVGTIKFEDKDCVRNPIIPKILEKLRLLK